MHFRTNGTVPPATKPSERVQQEVIALAFKDFGLQDVNTCESTQQMLESRAVQRFPLGDQELLCRHMHAVCAQAVDEYRREEATLA